MLKVLIKLCVTQRLFIRFAERSSDRCYLQKYVRQQLVEDAVQFSPVLKCWWSFALLRPVSDLLIAVLMLIAWISSLQSAPLCPLLSLPLFIDSLPNALDRPIYFSFPTGLLFSCLLKKSPQKVQLDHPCVFQKLSPKFLRFHNNLSYIITAKSHKYRWFFIQ